jgi:hypothetical protein
MMKHLNPLVVLLLALSLALSLVSCGGTTTKPQPNPTDKTAPTLSSSLPAEGASAVPINAKLGFVFSEAMDEDSLELSSTPPLTLGTPIWNASSTEVVFDNATLAVSTPYTLTLKAKDKAGNALSGDNKITFTTGEDIPILLSSTPANGSTDIPVEPFEIKLVFSKPMNRTTVGVEPTLEPDRLPNFGGESFAKDWVLTWNAEDTVLTIISLSDFDYFIEDTTYTLRLTGKSKEGLALTDTTITFKTVEDSKPPVIGFTRPFDGSTNTQLSFVEVLIAFNDLVDMPATIAAISSAPSLPCEWQQSTERANGEEPPMISILSCRSETEKFLPDTTYTIIIGTSAKDTSGNALAEPYGVRFTTIKGIGSLQVNVNDLLIDQKKVRVTGPNGFDSGLLDSSTSFPSLPGGDYTVTASSFVLAPGKPACRSYTPTPASQTVTVRASQTTTATVTYESESCALPDF